MYRKFHKLRVRFAELDLTQNEAAKRAGLAVSTMSSRMTGKVPFTIVEVQALCRALDIPQEQIGAYFFRGRAQGKEGCVIL